MDALVPRVVQLGGDPYLLPWNAGVFDTETNLSLVAVSERCVDVAISGVEGCFDCFADFVWSTLPGSYQVGAFESAAFYNE